MSLPAADLTQRLFENKPVRFITGEDGQPWFFAVDVCRIMEIANSRDAIRVLDDDEKALIEAAHNTDGAKINDLGSGSGNNSTWIISEPGLYKLLGRSRKPEAKRFDRWVRHEVLPEIRRTGGYMVAAPDETPEELALRALTVLQATVERQKAQLAVAQPKAEALDRIATADGSLCITDAAKALQIRPKDLFGYLQQNGWIYKRPGGSHFLGYQSKTLSGLLEHKVTTVVRGDGSEKVVEQVLVTARGLTRLASLIKPMGLVA